MKNKQKKVVIIGGGTGTMAVLGWLKKCKDLDISVIVSMTDDGGSNAVVRDEFGLLPLSDLRKSIIALSEIETGVLRKLFTYRFSKGWGLSGHTLGNLMMMALSDITGSEVKAIEESKKLFQVRGKVIPVTLQKAHLVAEYESGKKVTGEHLIDEPKYSKKIGRISKLFLSPKNVTANPTAIKAIREADIIVAGPGDLYTTTLANLIVPGISQAIAKSRAKFVFINNIMSKYGQTTGMKAKDLVREVEKYVGRAPDFVVVHHGKLPKEILQRYAKQGESPIVDNLSDSDSYKILRRDLLDNKKITLEKGDELKRSLLRHDSVRLGKVIYKIAISN